MVHVMLNPQTRSSTSVSCIVYMQDGFSVIPATIKTTHVIKAFLQHYIQYQEHVGPYTHKHLGRGGGRKLVLKESPFCCNHSRYN